MNSFFNPSAAERRCSLLGIFLALWMMLASSSFAQAPAASGGVAPATDPAQLDQLVGPIALYPDDLVGIILPGSTYPVEIVQADRFLDKRKSDKNLKVNDTWHDSVKSLLNYPDVVKKMSTDLDWTTALGEAVVADQNSVLEAIQRFRRQVQAAGNLKSDDKQTVVVEKEVIQVVQANPEVIYVPQYNPSTVVVAGGYPSYGYYPAPNPVYYYPYPPGAAFATGLIWGAAITAAWNGGHYATHYGGGNNNINVNRNTTINTGNINTGNVNRSTQGTAWKSEKQPGQVGGTAGRSANTARAGDLPGGANQFPLQAGLVEAAGEGGVGPLHVERQDHAAAPVVAHPGMLTQGLQQLVQAFRELPVGGDHVVLLEDVQGGQGGPAGQGVAGVGMGVEEAPGHRVVEEGLVHGVGGQHRGQGQVAAGDALGEAEKIGAHRFAVHRGLLVGEEGPAAAEAHGDLVADEVHAVAVAGLSRQGQVERIVHGHAGGALDQGLDDEGGDVAVVGLQMGFQGRGGAPGHVGGGLAVPRQAGIGGGQHGGGADQGGVGILEQGHVGDRQGAHGLSVVAAFEAKEIGLLRPARVAPVVVRHLQGDLGGRGAVGGVEGVAQGAAGEGGEALESCTTGSWVKPARITCSRVSSWSSRPR